MKARENERDDKQSRGNVVRVARGIGLESPAVPTYCWLYRLNFYFSIFVFLEAIWGRREGRGGENGWS